jgi:hypothetical protein
MREIEPRFWVTYYFRTRIEHRVIEPIGRTFTR